MHRLLLWHLNSPWTQASLVGIGFSSLPSLQLISLFPLQERGMQRPVSRQGNSRVGIHGNCVTSSSPSGQSAKPSRTLCLRMHLPLLLHRNSVRLSHSLTTVVSSIPGSQSFWPSPTHSRGMHRNVPFRRQENSDNRQLGNTFVSSLWSVISMVLQSENPLLTKLLGTHSLLREHWNSTEGKQSFKP